MSNKVFLSVALTFLIKLIISAKDTLQIYNFINDI